MREAAAVVKKLGQKVAKNIKLAMVVPGSGLVKEQAENGEPRTPCVKQGQEEPALGRHVAPA
jgi:homoaconitase/3-isopropylmalate dehydratase large subunit